jgi:hypothetical protein
MLQLLHLLLMVNWLHKLILLALVIRHVVVLGRLIILLIICFNRLTESGLSDLRILLLL